MARPGLDKHVKFRRLVRMLGAPLPHVRGYLECLWEVAYENGDDVIGDAESVEAAAHYPGEPGKLFAALRDCGGEGRIGFIEATDRPNEWAVHDLFDHAPEYVTDRRQKEEERRRPKTCLACNAPFKSGERRAKFCSDVCRVRHWRSTHGDEQSVTDETQCNAGLRTETQCNGTPAPAPAPLNTGTGACAAEGTKNESVFAGVTADTLRDTTALLDWWRKASAAERPVIGPSEADRLRVVSVAERALEHGQNPPALFTSIITKQQWHYLTNEHDDRAQKRLREHARDGPARLSPGVAKPSPSFLRKP